MTAEQSKGLGQINIGVVSFTINFVTIQFWSSSHKKTYVEINDFDTGYNKRF